MKSSRRKQSDRIQKRSAPEPLLNGSARSRDMVWGVLVVVLAVLGLYCFLPLSSALVFGGDEGYELMKGMLVSNGYRLYEQIWCDQTPLFPVLFGWLFKTFGFSIGAARLVAAAFGLLLYGSMFLVVARRHGMLAGMLAAPTVLEISVSVMQEVPAFAVGLVAVLLLFCWQKQRQWFWLVASGGLMGIALGIKVTALLFMPAMLVEIAFLSARSGPWNWKAALADVLRWGAGMIGVLGVALLLWGQGSLEVTWKTQANHSAPPGNERMEAFTIPPMIFTNHGECFAAALAIGVVGLRRHNWRIMAFPMVLLLTSVGVHLVHRPWWMYYYVHIAIPLAWLTGICLSETITRVLNRIEKRRDMWSGRVTSLLLLCLAALVFVRSAGRLQNAIIELQGREKIGSSAMVAKMIEHIPETHWVYAAPGREYYAFHAGRLMPPEIAVVSLKRFWSGQITTKEIIEICRRYNVEQLLLDPHQLDEYWRSFLGQYDEIHHSNHLSLYILKVVHRK